MNETKPLVSIVVPCRNERQHIEHCVRSILAQESSAGGFEVIIADGMSNDGTRNVLKRLEGEDPRLRIIDNPGQTAAAGLNAAIRIARGDIIMRMDAHTRYAPDYVRQCVLVLEETGADNVGGPWIAEGRGLTSSAIAAAFQSPFAVGGARGHNPSYEGELDTVYLGCWRRDVFDRVGLFDEELVRSEDDEFNLRLVRAGGKIWQSPRIKSWYTPRDSLSFLFRQCVQDGYWKVRVIQKHTLPASVRHLVPGTFVTFMVALPLASLWWPDISPLWLGLVGVYSTASLGAAVVAVKRRGWTSFPVIPAAFFCYHFGYGYGFLRGIVDLFVFKGKRNEKFTKLTRTLVNDVKHE